MWRRGVGLTATRRSPTGVLVGGVLVGVVLVSAACSSPDPELLPDERLRTELGLTDDDRVHTVRLRTGVAERAEPDSLEVASGDLVQFVATDWMVHEVHFALDSLGPSERGFLEQTGQAASPPLLQEDARFVVSFREAPAGRYPFRLEGNRASGSGVVVVTSEAAR